MKKICAKNGKTLDWYHGCGEILKAKSRNHRGTRRKEILRNNKNLRGTRIKNHPQLALWGYFMVASFAGSGPLRPRLPLIYNLWALAPAAHRQLGRKAILQSHRMAGLLIDVMQQNRPGATGGTGARAHGLSCFLTRP